MKRIVVIFLLVLFAAVSTIPAQGQKSLAATMNVYVFPSSGQDSATQSQDEASCYNWAVQNTGTDPFELAKQAEAQQQQAEAAKQQVDEAGQCAGAKGAVGGAAAGAVVGKVVSDDAGKGAAAGAAVGGIAGRRGRKSAQNQAKNDIDETSQQASKATAEQLTNFKKAFAVCLEAKDYMVKF
jgi:hypothetical protein